MKHKSTLIHILTISIIVLLITRVQSAADPTSVGFERSFQVPFGGEVTGDDRIDILDLVIIASHFRSNDKNIDINGNGVVDIYDLTVAAVNYGKSGPVVNWQ